MSSSAMNASMPFWYLYVRFASYLASSPYIPVISSIILSSASSAASISFTYPIVSPFSIVSYPASILPA